MMKSQIPRLNLVIVLAIFLGGGVFIAAWAVIWAMRGSYLTAFVMFGAAVVCFALLCHLIYVAWARPQPRREYDLQGTVIRSSKFLDFLFGTGFVAGVFASLIYLSCTPLGMIDYVPTGVMRVTVPSACIFFLVFGLFNLFRMVKNGSESCLRLGPSDFKAWSGFWGSSGRGNWVDVEQISDQLPRGKTIRRELIVFVLPKGRSVMFVADAVTNNPQALREWVRFYWQHPDYRAELTDGRALRRLDEEKFTPS